MNSSKDVIVEMINYYLSNMAMLSKSYDDKNAYDLEIWYAANSIYKSYINTGKINENDLLRYFGEDETNRESTDLALSFFRIMKYASTI